MSRKSLGTLTLDLVARTGGFVQGMDQAERSSQKWRKQVEKDLQTVARVSGAAIGAVAAATTALVVTQVKAATELRQQAQLSAATTQEFQRYAIAAGTVGISQEKLSDQLKDFNEKAGEFQRSGGGGMKDFFEQIAPQIGITADAFRDLSGPQALQLYYDSLEKAGLSQQQMSFYLESMASDTTALIPLLRNGGEGFKLLGDMAEDAGAIMSEETVSAAEKLSAVMWVSQQSMAGFRNQIAEKLLPTLADLAVQFSDVATETVIADDVANTLNGTIKGLAATAVGAFASFQLLGRGIAGLVAASEALNKDIPWYDKLTPTRALQGMVKNLGEAKDLLVITGDDLEETAQRYATLLNGIWSAGEGEGGNQNSENRIAQLAEFMKRMREEAAKSGPGLATFSDEANKSADAIKNQLSALERAAATWGMSANEVKLYDMTVQGATDSQLMHAQAVMRNIDAMEQQAEAAKRAIEDQKRINQEAQGIAESLLTEEERILASYERRRQIILDNTKITGEAQTELLRRLEEERNEQLIEVNGSYWEKWLAGAEDALTSFDALAGSVVDNFQSQFGSAFESMIFDAQSLDEAIAGMGESMARSVVNAIGQMIAQWLAYQAVQLLVGKTTQASAAAQITGNAYAGVMQAGINAFASTAAIPIVGPAAAPAAMTAAVAATSPMAAAASTYALLGMAHDGIDSIPKTGTWLLEKGERVTTAETSAKLDRKLDMIQPGGGGGITIHAPVTVEAQPGMSAADAQRQGEAVSGAIRATVVSTLEKESRPGGLLWQLYGGGR